MVYCPGYRTLFKILYQAFSLTQCTLLASLTYDNVTDLYLFFNNRLGKEISQLPGLQHLARFQLVDILTACTPPDVKINYYLEAIPRSSKFFASHNCNSGIWHGCRHLKCLKRDTLGCAYFRQTGRAGRDGLPALATVDMT